jgi:hypothetical protein
MKYVIYFISIAIVLVISYLAFYMVEEGFKSPNFVLGTTGVSKRCTPDSPVYGDPTICYDISYIDQTTSITKQMKAQIQPGYFINSSGLLEIVPYGYIASSDKRSYLPESNTAIYEKAYFTNVNSMIDASINRIQDLIKTANTTDLSGYHAELVDLQKKRMSVSDDNKTSNKLYNSDNLDITYHADPLKEIPPDANNLTVGQMWIKDADGNLKSVPYDEVKNTTLYYPSGSYVFNPPKFIPNYEESVFLSGASNVPIVGEYQGSKLHSEMSCNAMNKDACMKSGNCVLFGGEKCVAGDAKGPIIKSNYSDITIINRDYYYYKGTCYGNCR